MALNKMIGQFPADLYVLRDESNPRSSERKQVWASTTLDQVFDQTRPDHKSLRTILEELRQEIITGGKGNIIFPVTTVNGQTGDVRLTAESVGLDAVDNTRDADKPLSNPQRDAIMAILRNYDFNVDLQDLYDHMADRNNPHRITLEQLNQDESFTKFIRAMINKHNYSTDTNTHMDIRRSLAHLWNIVDHLDDGVDEKIDGISRTLQDHFEDVYAHQDLFDEKENVASKARYFSDEQNNDYTKYPSTHAVVEYVMSKITDYDRSLPKISGWIDDILVVNRRADVPPASEATHRKAYFIRYGEGSMAEVAICRLNAASGVYAWEYSQLGVYSKFNPHHFHDTAEGLSLDTTAIITEIINHDIDRTLDKLLSGYYKKEEVDRLVSTESIKILPGTMDGTIRYYTNGDPNTMTDDVPVAGLHRLAYLEYVTEREIYDQAVHERHILNRAIATRHIQERAVKHEKIHCPPGYIIGNIDDATNTAQLIPITKLREILGVPTTPTDEEMRSSTLNEIWDGKYVNKPGDDDPSACGCSGIPVGKVTDMWNGKPVDSSTDDSTCTSGHETIDTSEVDDIWNN